MLRLFSVGLLALLLRMPIEMIGDRVAERQATRDAAVAEVSSKWGDAQVLTGPALVIPFISRDESGEPVSQSRNAVFLPERMHARGSLDSDTRQRGIFAVPVYRLDLDVEGEFARPDAAKLGGDATTLDWGRARLVVGVSDVRAIQREVAVSWNGQSVPFVSGTGEWFVDGGPGIQAPVTLPDGDGPIAFSFPLALNGSRALSFAPFGQTTVVEFQSDYPHPSFQGNWLPSERTVTDTSFAAKWSIPFLGRNFPQAWIGGPMREAIESSRFGVELIDPVDHYRMADRSVKYAELFILLTFSAVWLIEVLAAVRVHPIQYLLLGSALCLFYLLELSLAEHLSFLTSYALASVSIIAMVAAYCTAVLHRVSRAAIVGSGVALLYGYLYTLLMNEDYALLAGSIGLFLILAAIMYATRGVDWYAIGASSAERRSA